MSNKISAARLIVGGAAMLAAENKNHRAVINGKYASIPLVINRLRVCVVSYKAFAKANRAEEDRPCAIIISITPSHPQRVFDIRPAVKSPIWPTEE